MWQTVNVLNKRYDPTGQKRGQYARWATMLHQTCSDIPAWPFEVTLEVPADSNLLPSSTMR